ncbi:hypothetical protein GGR50DRAFT_688306 [Xylaria sp. CBS 124048]|nr:hypothetical protein GGR50DRAFT_688306 [Xylaria sp. CBS 124048]
MEITSLQKLLNGLQAPALTRRYSDAAVGLLLIFSVQLLVLPAQIALNLHFINLPASILVMFLILITMTMASSATEKIEPFYNRHIRGPTDFVWRHISLGFVAFSIMLIRDHVNHASDVPKLAGVFVVTTILGYVTSFLFAIGAFWVERRVRRPRQSTNDLESYNKVWPSPSIAWPAQPIKRQPKRIPQLSWLSEALSARESFIGIGTLINRPTAASIDFTLRTAPILVCLFLLLAFGLPVYLLTDYAMPLDVFTFVVLWALSIQFQRSLRTSHTFQRLRRLRSFLIIFTNPLLVTWALGTAYMWVKTLYTGKSIHTIIGEFRQYSSLSESIIHIVEDRDIFTNLGAGDLASLLLDAGVACMGFKIYEYRKELWASLGTVLFTCTTLAAINVFLNVLVGHGLGLPAEEAIAFASRSATLALGIPAVENLGGSTTLTSAVAIFSGILFQMLGDWFFSVLRIDDRRSSGADSAQRSGSAKINTLFHTTKAAGEAEKESASRGHSDKAVEDGAVVAAGIAVGINAAAMGTAYLVERDSRATAYSALSMIIFGATTVALTALPGAAGAVTALTRR